MTFRGNLLLYSLWYELHPFENLRRKGVNEHGPVQMSGVSGKFFSVYWSLRNGRKKFIAKGHAGPGQPGGLCLSQPRRKGLKR